MTAYWLVQRITESPYERHRKAFPNAKVKSNPFGYGRLGDYELDYMGSAEFEFGAIPESWDRFRKAGDGLVLCEWTYKGHEFDFLYIGNEGEPFDAWTDWAEGRRRYDWDDRVHEVPPFDGKEPAYELRQRICHEERPRASAWRTAVWWALEENVMWAFKADGHLPRMIGSMGETKVVELRG